MFRRTTTTHLLAAEREASLKLRGVYRSVKVARLSGGLVTIPGEFNSGGPLVLTVEQAEAALPLLRDMLIDEAMDRLQKREQEVEEELQALLRELHQPPEEEQKPDITQAPPADVWRPFHPPHALADYSSASPRGHFSTYSVACTHLLF